MENSNWAVYHSNKVHGDDAYLVPRTLSPDSRLYLVCDGVSGVMKGENLINGGGKIASQQVVQRLSQAPIAGIEDIVNEFMQISDELLRTSERTAMTTATAALLKKTRLYVANIGDSPAFLIRDFKAIPLTENHTEQRDGREYLTKAIGMGTEDGFRPGIYVLDTLPNDILVLTTDGVRMTPDELADALSKEKTPSAMSKKIEEFLKNTIGTEHDDITAVVVRF